MRITSDTLPSRAVLADGGAPALHDAEHAASFAHVLEGLGHELDRGERGVRSAIRAMSSGAELGPERLIALQVGVYRYSDAIDLASRLVDRTTGAVKTLLQGGGQ